MGISEIHFVPHHNYKLVFEDDFEGTALNEAEWMYRIDERLGRFNLRENVTLKDGRLAIRYAKQEIHGNNGYTGGGIISKRLFGYGYYEAKGKLWGGCGGLHSSFWAMGISGDGVQTPKFNTLIEIDGYEVDSGRPSSIGMNVHYYVGTQKTIGGVKGTRDYRTIDTSEEDFVFGFEWLPNQINWYLNGELIRHLENPQFYGPQNVWLTALGSEAFDRNIDDSKLPGESSWDYFRFYQIDLPGVNLVVNPGFEYNKNKDFEASYIRDLSLPVGWCKEGNTPNASYIFETEEAYSGECVLRHDFGSPYQITTKVNIPFLPNATYVLSAMVRNPENGCHKMKIIDQAGMEWHLDIPKTEASQWSKVTMDPVRIEGGACTVAFSSDSEGGCPLEVDEVAMVQISGKPPHTELAPFREEEKKPFLPLGEILVDGELPGSGYAEFGEWNGSGLPGFVLRSRYASALPDHYATWTPELKEPGEYKVSFYNICHEARAAKAKVELVHQGGIEENLISQRGKSGWVELGTFRLKQGDYVRLSSVADSAGGSLAADTVKFEPKSAARLRALVDPSCLFMIDQAKALCYGKFEKIDKENPAVKTCLWNGCIMVPIAFAASAFGAGTIHSDREKGTIDIFYKDYMIRFRDGAGTMNVHNQEIAMQTSALLLDNCLYAPLSAIAQAFGKTVFKFPNGLSLVSDRDLGLHSELDEVALDLLSGLFKL